MPLPSKRKRKKSVSAPINAAIHGRPLQNKILLALPLREQKLIFPKLTFEVFRLANKLGERGVPIKFGFFLNDGLASILNALASKKLIEVGLCGSEGFVGLPLTVGFKTNSAQIIMQVAGSGFRIRATDLVSLLEVCPLTLALARLSHEMGLQAAQVPGSHQW